MNPIQRVLELSEIATRISPAFTSGMDFSERGSAFGRPGDPNDYERLAERSFTAAEAFLAHRDRLMVIAEKQVVEIAAKNRAEKERFDREVAERMAKDDAEEAEQMKGAAAHG